jgi:hypothetical protein
MVRHSFGLVVATMAAKYEVLGQAAHRSSVRIK